MKSMTSWNLISHVCETRKFVMAILHWKQGLLCDKTEYAKTARSFMSDNKIHFTLSEKSPGFYLSCLWQKEKLHLTSNFSFSHSVFYHFGELSVFIKFLILVCKTISVWKSLKFVFRERVKYE